MRNIKIPLEVSVEAHISIKDSSGEIVAYCPTESIASFIVSSMNSIYSFVDSVESMLELEGGERRFYEASESEYHDAFSTVRDSLAKVKDHIDHD